MPNAPESPQKSALRMIWGMPTAVFWWSVVIGATLGVVFTLIVVRPHRRAIPAPPKPDSSVTVTLLEPLGPVATTPRQFRWTRVAGATRYRLELIDAKGQTVASVITADTLVAVTSLTHAAPNSGLWRVHPLGQDGRELGAGASAVFELAY